MSLLSELTPYPGSRKIKKRLGRGKGSGKGGTSTKGHKGQKARKGVSIPAGFEGGGMPLSRRLPKFGFTNARFKVEWEIVNLSELLNWEEKEVTPELLVKKGLVSSKKPVKILAKQGEEFKKPLVVKAHKFSGKAKELIEKAGGKIFVLSNQSDSENKKKENEKKST